MSKDTHKIINSLINGVISHLSDRIQNALENSEITREMTHNEATGETNFSFHINLGKAASECAPGFTIENGTLKSWHGNEKDITIPDGVRVIAQKAFANRLIRSVSIPDSVEIIEDRAFFECYQLESVQFGNGLKEIGERAFEGCSEVPEIDLPQSLKVLKKRAFAECWMLEKASLPDELQHIPDELFKGCVLIETVRWPKQPITHGNDIFDDCIEPDSWSYFEIQDGICKRIKANPAILDPDGLFNLNQAYYPQSRANRLLNWIWQDSLLNRAKNKPRMELCRFALKCSAILSSCDIYAAMQTTEMCLNLLKKQSELPREREILQKVLETICGNGENWRQSDVHICQTILESEDFNDGTIHEIAHKSFISLMDDLKISIGPNRYHPAIYHYGAQKGQVYWDFVAGIEGMLRHYGFDISHLEVLCDPEDNLDEWICSWSKVIAPADLVILRFSFTDDESKDWFCLMEHARADAMYDLLQDSREILSGWQNGQKLFALTII